MRIIVCGTRSIKIGAVDLVDGAIKESGWTPTEIISGGADGIDTAAREWAKKNGVDFVEIHANWKGRGKAAGYKRNQKMAWYATILKEMKECVERYQKLSDEKCAMGCIAVWDGKSKGTKHMVDIARESGIPVYIKMVDNSD